MSSRICSWIVTSSAVVGSSAMSSLGSQASAIAIITRWRMPPESWCGYSSTRSRGRGQADQVEHLDRPLARSSLLDLAVRGTASATCLPTVTSGSATTSGPGRSSRSRRRASCALLRPQLGSSRPPSWIEPPRCGPVGQQPHDRQRGHGLAAAGLADDAERLALGDLSVTPSTACTLRPRNSISVRRSVISRSATSCCPPTGAAAGSRRVAERVTDEVEREQIKMIATPGGRSATIIAALDIVEAAPEHRAPVRVGRRDAQGEEAQIDRVMIASATANVAWTMIVPIALGTMCLTTTAQRRPPIPLTACTYSRVRRESVSPRTRRASRTSRRPR